MRILSLSFRNLNSLAGDWSIDFRAPEYEASGIFAITGPTGAGKSTILDAICLALYGSTPRLPNISKNVNDIMTRGTGDCYADVTFRTTKGEFRCRWSQRKARGKADGNLQQPKHELFDAEGTPLADKMQDVARMVEELTGMDFGRFTQSTLLAQGRFATFLLAEGRDRAPLLEQMTGTAIYSQISEHIFQRNKEEQARLESLDAELAHCSVLSEEEELALKGECSNLSLAIAGTGEKEKELNAGLHLLQLCSALEQERKALLEGQALLERELQHFANDSKRLDTARRALLFSAECSALLTQQKEQERDNAEANALNAALIPLGEEVQKEESLHHLVTSRIDKERKAHIDLLETLKGVRALDLQIKERQAEKAQREVTEREAVRHEAAIGASLAKHVALLEKDRISLKETNAWLEGRAMDAELPQHLSALHISSTQLYQQKKRIDARKLALEEKRRDLELKALSCEKQGALHATFSVENKKLEDAVTALEAERLNILAGKSPADWRKDQDCLNALEARLGRMLDFNRSRHALRVRCAELDSQLKELSHGIENETALLRSDEARLNDVQALRQELAESLALLERIRSYKEARLLLEDGTPCPLCGALHHPYAEGNLPAPDEKREQLQSCEQNIRILNDQLGKRRASLASLERDKEHNTSLLQEKNAEAEDLATRLVREAEALPPEISLAVAGDEKLLENALEAHRQHCHEKLSEVAAVLVQAEERMERLHALRERLELARKNAELALRGLRDVEQEKTALEAEVRGLEHELEAEVTLFESAFDNLRVELTALGYVAHKVEEIPGVLQRLEARLEAFLKKQAAAEALATSCRELEKLCLVEEQERNDAGKRLVELRDNLAKLTVALESLQKERHERFGNRDADLAEQEGMTRLHLLEAELRECVARLDSARKKRDNNATRFSMLQKRLAERAVSLAANELALNAELTKAGFNGLQHCLESCLSDKEREALEERDRALKERKTGLQARLDDNERRRSEITELPDSNEEKLKEALEELKARQAAMQEELGAKREKLENNASRKKTALKVFEDRQKQEAVCRRWADLNKLIGSADGQKFRNYAQELTFRSLIRHANRQLASMTDRYLLVQSPDEALSLSVIDHYQADAVRTSRNLSGGESFLVSLSLALGLARMASLSVSVDSVFLDEGFGTLDEDSLNMALDMLSNLRQQGKVIGIISHVQAIRERIGTRIQVESGGNGRSILLGPGIKKISNKD